MRQYFNPRPRMGSDVNPSTPVVTMGIFQSTPPAWGATCRSAYTGHPAYHFNPRSRMGSDHATADTAAPAMIFQSTPPAWGATQKRRVSLERAIISIHAPPHGERLRWHIANYHNIRFQSTPPAWGATSLYSSRFNRLKIFQSTPPAWGATTGKGVGSITISISIHAPRMGSDHQPRTARGSQNHFNPRSPHGERHQ